MTSSLAAPDARIVAVCSAPTHVFSKSARDAITLRENHGVEGDAHAGATVKHRSRLKKFADQPNLRQVHLMHAELFDALAAKGFTITPGQLGENVTTRGIDLLALPEGSELQLGASARVRITGLRNPCNQIEDFGAGLLREVLDRNEHGELVRKTGVMGIVVADGEIRPGDAIRLLLPQPPHRPLAPV
ncbi:MAG: MOSC domain-containing protein [Xanthomonadales bacterium]|nr:MOSC domain-containing protein [Xanthomonadales bacterium]